MPQRSIDVAALVDTIAETGAATERSIVPERHRALQRRRIEAMLANVGRLTIGASIGEGGRGLVRAAGQLGLDREVAVKTVRGDSSDEAVAELLQEALVTGSLEHPNIVPVHYIGVDDGGDPFIVLKKIEGETWDRLIGDHDLETDLRILLEVINAVRFAHSRAIVHRDLKPANVMVGPFGEVYVLDWGLAVSLADDAGLVPSAAEQSGVAGTLGYMAPEMLSSTDLSPRTDVYLLGAVLYEIAVGRPPHRGASVPEIVESILASEPEVAAGVPAELAAIIRRAMRADPAERYASAGELKEAIEQFLVHRAAAELTASTSERLDALLEACAGEPDHDHVYNLFGECRFGFREAIRRWPEGDGARRGLERAVVAMVDHELERGDPVAAGRLLAELDHPPAATRDRVDAALAQQREKLASLARLEADLDPTVGGAWRMAGVIAVGLVCVGVFGIAPLVSPALIESPTWGQLFGLMGGVGVALALLAVILWRTIRASRPNRLLGLMGLCVWTATVAAFVLLWQVDADPTSVRLIHPPLWFAIGAMGAGAVDRRLWPTPVLMLVVGPLVPGLSWNASFYALLASVVFAIGNVVWVSRRWKLEAD